MLEIISNVIGIVAAIVSIIGLIIQNKLSSQEQGSFRQQLIAVLHHAEGVTDSLSSIENAINKDTDPIFRASIEAIRKNAATLQMGLMETKVGGKQLADDLDQSYKDWAKIELDMRKLPLKHVMEIAELQQKEKIKEIEKNITKKN